MRNEIGPRPTVAPEAETERLLQAYEGLDGSPEQAKQAVKVLVDLAERGSSMSMLYLGYAFHNGVGAVANDQCAEEWYRRAADAGLLRAHYSLGRFYLDKLRYVEAKQEFERAASMGFVPGTHFLGRIYYYGFGVPVDKPRGKKLLKSASEWGCVFAKALLAHDLIHEGGDIRAVARGLFIKLACYFDMIQILWTDGLTSDRFR